MAASLLKVCCGQLPLTTGRSGSLLLTGACRVQWTQQGSRRALSSGRRRLSAASLGLAARVRPLPILLFTGGGYVGYDQYGRYKDRRLESMGIEVPPRIASEVQVGTGPAVRDRGTEREVRLPVARVPALFFSHCPPLEPIPVDTS
ncbi:hypothetical protein MATL_G00083290 [Megalops atlanticus]|uniref:Uncharacterized protein n=1 Tax=Megalops atlanticus TaxID=7932 RepID=A0A9D3Q7Q6_MEGAT|nr:hypothetical protein MATL_G00083290 [Megalops atlanticus]